MSSPWVDQVMGNLHVATSDALEQMGSDVVADVKLRLSTPYPPASAPGEDPHLRLGRLRDGVSHEVLPAGADVLELSVWSDRVPGDPNVPFYLATGTQYMAPRPYMQNTFTDWSQRMAPRVGIAVRSGMSL